MTDAPDRLSLSAAKKNLRRDIILQRDALETVTRAAASARITNQILALQCFARARGVLAYAGMGSEFDTGALLSHVMAHKKLALPRVDHATRSLQLYWVNDLETDLQPGVWGIREPRPDRCVPAPPDEIDLVLAPGVAFTQRGERLGYGGGYYDQLLAVLARFAMRPTVVAGAFDIQMATEVPLATTDVPVDIVVTENTVYTR